MTQKEFLEKYYSDPSGKPYISIATLSNLEARGGQRLQEVLESFSNKTGIGVELFDLPTIEFRKAVLARIEAKRAVTAGGGEPDSQRKEEPDSDGVFMVAQEKKGSAGPLINRMTDYFAGQFFNGTLHRGEKIESDRDLAARFGVGRSSVREALKVLEVLGMIDIRPGQGTYISESEENFFQIPLSWSLFLGESQIEEILEVRKILQERAAFLSAGCKDGRCLEQLNSSYQHMQKSFREKNYDAFLDNDLEFHSAIAACSGNQVIYSMNQIISMLMRRISRSGMDNEKQLETIYDEHQKIYGLILAGDAEGALAAMQDHLRSSSLRYNY